MTTIKILWLPIKEKWFNMIRDDLKPEEYRELSAYWRKRIDLDDPPRIIALRNGYGKDRPTLYRRCWRITIGRGNPAWGAPVDRDVFIIHLGPECWSPERLLKWRATRKRNRRLRELGELIARNPLFWKQEAKEKGYGDLVDDWNGQRKTRKKKPNAPSAQISWYGARMDVFTGKVKSEVKKVDLRRIPTFDEILVVAKSRKGNKYPSKITGVDVDFLLLANLTKGLGMRYPRKAGWKVYVVFITYEDSDELIQVLQNS